MADTLNENKKVNCENFSIGKQSRWLRQSRRALGISVKTLAESMGVTPRTVNAWENENNTNLPSREKLFVYLELMFGQHILWEPGRLVHTTRNLSEPDSHRPTVALSQRFVRLNKQQRSLVNLVIHSLYKEKNRRNRRDDKTDKDSED
ncbi:MAG: helix-turn-helix transcriptional regulator [Pseudomonadota bacterium]|nr:helix-turn-helix transcriptional regulator [Pseudomonadota bacterium]